MSYFFLQSHLLFYYNPAPFSPTSTALAIHTNSGREPDSQILVVAVGSGTWEKGVSDIGDPIAAAALFPLAFPPPLHASSTSTLFGSRSRPTPHSALCIQISIQSLKRAEVPHDFVFIETTDGVYFLPWTWTSSCHFSSFGIQQICI